MMDRAYYFPDYNLIKESFKSRLIDFDYVKRNYTDKDEKIFYEYNHPTIIIEYEKIKFKCRLKSDSYFRDEEFWKMEKPKFSISIDYSYGREIRGIYYLENYSELWIWPVVDNIKIALDKSFIKNCYMAWPGFDWSESFVGYIMDYKHGIDDPKQVPLKLIENDPGEFDLEQFISSDEAKNVNKKNGGY